MTKEQAIKTLEAILEIEEVYDYRFGEKTREKIKQLLEIILKGDEMESEE